MSPREHENGVFAWKAFSKSCVFGDRFHQTRGREAKMENSDKKGDACSLLRRRSLGSSRNLSSPGGGKRDEPKERLRRRLGCVWTGPKLSNNVRLWKHKLLLLTRLTLFSLVSRMTLTTLCLSSPLTGNIHAGDLG